jgi:hypothetical protein
MSGESANYISLKEAVLLCEYSQEYLNLIVRKGKLRAVKIGRNWVTKKEWLESYLKMIAKKRARAAECSARRAGRHNSVAIVLGGGDAHSMVDSAIECGQKISVHAVSALPENNDYRYLPPRPAASQCPAMLKKNSAASIGYFAIVAVFVLAVVIFFQKNFPIVAGTTSFLRVRSVAAINVSRVSQSSLAVMAASLESTWKRNATILGIGDFFSCCRQFLTVIGNGIRNGGGKFAGFINYIFHGKAEVVEIAQTASGGIDKTVLERNADILEKNITNDAHDRVDQFRIELGLPVAREVAGGTPQAMVVVPSTGDRVGDEELKKKIEQSFSDDVAVNSVDDTSGVIVPQFRDKQEESDYLYMMVPLNKNNNK